MLSASHNLVTHTAAVRRAAFVGALILLSGCEAVEEAAQRWIPATPHEHYRAALEAAGLDETALGRDWLHQADLAFDEPRPIDLPFREEVFITAEQPTAHGVRFTLPRGRRITVRLQVDSDEDTQVFLDVVRVPDDSTAQPRPLLTADTIDGGLTYEPWRGGDFIVRLQPELLRGGTFTLTIDTEAALAFPVHDHSIRSIQSFFGAERDAGRRSHHGVDIFAPRGTPVVASVPGRVRRVEQTNLGGNVVWVRDDRFNRSLYYAHLDTQSVADGDWVAVGDTLGFVGNTGNARTTPPHLHYGIYYRGEGPVDPLPFLQPSERRAPAVTADREPLGSWVEVRNEGLRLRSAASLRAAVVDELEPGSRMRVLGVNSDWYRVELPDGRGGYVAARLTTGMARGTTAELNSALTRDVLAGS